LDKVTRIDQYMILAANLTGPCKYNKNTWQEAEKIWMDNIKQLAIKLMKESDQMSAIR